MTDQRTRGAAWVADPYGWQGPHPFADQVQEREQPEFSRLLGPDGQPLRYQRQPIGFDQRAREERS